MWKFINGTIILTCLSVSTITITGCSSTIHAIPQSIPAVEGVTDRSFAGSELSVTCTEADANWVLVEQSARIGKVFVNRKEWCEYFVSFLKSELDKRGAKTTQGGKKLTLALPEVSAYMTYATIGFKPKALITSDSGWSKLYEGDDSATFYGDLIPRNTANRAAQLSLSNLAKIILMDSEFSAQVSGIKY